MAVIKAVAGILNKKNVILMANRPPDKSYSGYWEFPGGKIEKNETSIDALKRELQEELGIEIITAEFLFSHIHTYPDKTVHLEIWWVRSFSGIEQNRENQILQWFNVDEITKEKLKILEGNIFILDKIKTFFAGTNQ